MKKTVFPLIALIVVFLIAFLALQPEPSVPALVAAADLPAGHQLSDLDLEKRELPKSALGEGVILDAEALVGQTLKTARAEGDFFYPSTLGGETLELSKNERAVALHVTDSAGLAGLLKPGDRVALTVTFTREKMAEGEEERSGSYAKFLTGNLRVLYLSPDFQALDPASIAPSSGSDFSGGAPVRQRKADGVVVLAVPTALQIIAFDFMPYGSESETVPVSLVDLLPALDQSSEVALSLLLEPEEAEPFSTSGIFLPDLVVHPGPTATPGTQPEIPAP